MEEENEEKECNVKGREARGDERDGAGYEKQSDTENEAQRKSRGDTQGKNSNIPHKPFLPSKHLKMYIYYLGIFLLFLPETLWQTLFLDPCILPTPYKAMMMVMD